MAVSTFQRYYEVMETLYSRGQRAITFRAIAKTFSGVTRPDNWLVKDIVSKKGGLARRWEEERNQRPIPMRREFFERFSRPPYIREAGELRVPTSNQARAWLAVGSTPAVGFYIPEGLDDPFNIAWMEILSARGNGSAGRQLERVAHESEDGRLTDDVVDELVTERPIPQAILEAKQRVALPGMPAPPELGEGNAIGDE